MKKLLFISLALLFVMSCSNEEYEDLNRDPNNPTQVSAESLFTSSTVALFSQMESTSVNTNIFRLCAQYWTETTYTDESNYDLITRSIPDNFWSNLYRNVLYDLEDAKFSIPADDPNTANKQAQAELLIVYTWGVLVDTFGDIPYTEALKGQEYPSPKYDDAETIYLDLLARTDAALSSINTSGSGFTSADLVYGGDLDKWMKFGNSLKLKLAMRLSDSNPGIAGPAAAAAANAGVFTSNADNFILNFESSTPNTNPLWVALVQSGRNDFVVSNTLVDIMNTMQDPRRSVFMQENMGPDTYIGGVYGAVNTYALFTHIGTALEDPTFRGVLLDFAEVEFNLAEAAEKGFGVPGTAESHYMAGIQANMEDWGVDAADIATYMAMPEVAYTAADYRTQLGTQYWLAMYNRGLEGWYAHRKFDNPTLNLAARSSLPSPMRYTYPADEHTLNETNYMAASSAIGGDEQSTKLFWDKY